MKNHTSDDVRGKSDHSSAYAKGYVDLEIKNPRDTASLAEMQVRKKMLEQLVSDEFNIRY
jgi:hypothetical protein